MTDKKSKFFYAILKARKESRPNMETIYARNFNFENNKVIWKDIYEQKLVDINIVKVKEFNFKLLQNILPCGKVLSKWKPTISSKCSCCNEIETVLHMLFECNRIREIWNKISLCLNCNISWKNIVCGWPNYIRSSKIRSYNIIISTIAYSIFKVNSNCKFEEKIYNNVQLIRYICQYLSYYTNVILDIENNSLINMYVGRILDSLQGNSDD